MPQIIFYIIFAIIGLFLDNSNSNRRNSALDTDVVKWVRSLVQRRNRRISALKTAKNYLKPYEKIFGNLTLSNKSCVVTFNAKEKTITCISTVFNEQGQKMTLTAKNFSSIDIDEYFDMLCEIFGYNTKYKDIHSSLHSVAVVSEFCYKTDIKSTDNHTDKPSGNVVKQEKKQETKVIDIKTRSDILDLPEILTDVNNCSEAELTALPGISIILAKKIIAFREQQRPFKSVDDFIISMHIKPHFAKRLKEMICVKKVNMKKVKKAKAERIIDL